MQSLNIQSGYLPFEKGKIHCLRMGSGDAILLAFHGTGNSATLFRPLAECLAGTYTLLAIDLPGHGQTNWSASSFTEDDLMAIVYSIKLHYQVEKLTLLGYSLGGKLALTVAQRKPLWIQTLFLIAPDGIRKNFWYNFATRNIIGKQIFNGAMNHPEKFLRIMGVLNKLLLLPDNPYKTAKIVLSRPRSVEVIRNIWPLYSAIPVPDSFSTFNQAYIPLHLICGKYDRIFPYKFYRSYVKQFKNGHFHLLEGGHLLLNPEWLRPITNIIRNGKTD